MARIGNLLRQRRATIFRRKGSDSKGLRRLAVNTAIRVKLQIPQGLQDYIGQANHLFAGTELKARMLTYASHTRNGCSFSSQTKEDRRYETALPTGNTPHAAFCGAAGPGGRSDQD